MLTWQLHHAQSRAIVYNYINTKPKKCRLAERKREHQLKCSRQPNTNRSAGGLASVWVPSVIADLCRSKTQDYRSLFP